MKASDYIVNYLIFREIKHIFGYPGGMVTHLMNSLSHNRDNIHTHITYHEQAAAFAACGYAQSSNGVGVAFATSGPGATNLLTGVGHAYFDSIPVIFITGQVNTFESGRDTGLRQRGFQETDIVSMAAPITKFVKYVESPNELPNALDEAYRIAISGRPGPVLLDIPMDVMRGDISADFDIFDQNESRSDDNLECFNEENDKLFTILNDKLMNSKRPCLLIGNGIKGSGSIEHFRSVAMKYNIPIVSSMMAVDVVPQMEGLEGKYYGFIGAYGNRTANFAVAKSDLVICIGSRLDVRQVGANRSSFAPDADIIRIDIDKSELDNKIREDEMDFLLSVDNAIDVLDRAFSKADMDYTDWLNVCSEIKSHIKYMDELLPNRIINKISRYVPDGFSVVADVGQNMIWTAQSFRFKENQRIYMSGGMGSMGYALPAAIGIYYATGKPVICFTGDGGLQMNIQELQYLYREQLPIKIIVMNNKSLGMIRHFQEMYFEQNYCYTISGEGYDAPDFTDIARAYKIKAVSIDDIDQIEEFDFEKKEPELIEIILKDNTIIRPKLEFGKPNQDQEPLLDRKLYEYLMNL